MNFPATDKAELAAKLADPSRGNPAWQPTTRGRWPSCASARTAHDASTIIRDEGTARITGAFTRADRRGQGVAAALLDAALAWARDEGYIRCAVDFESANLLASRFWPRHFEVVGITLGRRL